MKSKLTITLNITTDNPEIEKRLILAAEDKDLNLIKFLTEYCESCIVTVGVKSVKSKQKGK